MVDVFSPVIAKRQAQSSIGSAPTTQVPEVTYAGFDYTGVKLNLPLARRDLQTAKDLIKQGDVKAAATALDDILIAGVIFQFGTVDEPLVRAMDNFRLAESEMKAGHPDQAKIALSGAADALNNYQRLAGESRAKEVATLHKEIDDLSKRIANEKVESFSKKVSEWWNRCRTWLGA